MDKKLKIINKTEAEERQYLERTKAKLRSVFESIFFNVEKRAKDIKKYKAFLWENKTGMDHAEKVSIRHSVDMSVLSGENELAKAKRIKKLFVSPYFGRFDFIEDGRLQPLPIYIGIHTFFDEKSNKNLVYDWRAPISSMFYDYELERAGYRAPSGKISGEIVLKRQYRIRKGQMEFMLESSVNILDDILQKELSCASDERMKNIVATIQRDQNAIIRNENSHVLIIQGVAGSGKTSIALHRIAFLLYKFKNTLTAKDILIISPNKVFADYVSSVLPELGEEKIPEIGMEKLAHEVLSYKYKFQTFFEQEALLLKKEDSKLKERIKVKSSVDFLAKLDEYIRHIESTHFSPAGITIKNRLVESNFIKERFNQHCSMPVFERLERIAKDVEQRLRIYHDCEVSARGREMIKRAVKKMFKFSTLRSAYKKFYVWLGEPRLFKLGNKSVFEYSDIFPLIYLKLGLEKVRKKHDSTKHLLIDEMQDYTPVQYAVLAKLFSCKKTILGDIKQSVNPFGSSDPKDIQSIFAGSDFVKLHKSYRSTYEITFFAQRILPDKDLVPIERHGEKPAVLGFKNHEQEITFIQKLVDSFYDFGYNSMGIICKRQKQAEGLYNCLHSRGRKVHLLTSHSLSFHQGVTICAAYMAKGLEFDHVVIPDVNKDNYSTAIDKNLLYVACTRAMHKLTLTFTGKITTFIKE